MKSTLLKALVAPLFVLGTMSAFAQANTVEVAAGGGLASYHNDGSANKGKFDASVSYNVVSNFSVGFEYGFSPIASLNENISGAQVSASEHLNSYGAVARIGLFKAAHVEPYAVIAGGGAKLSASATANGGGGNFTASASDNGGYFGLGGGVSAYLTPHIGVRPEVRYQYVHIDGDHLNEIDITGSIFYTFGGAGHHKR